MIPYTNIIFVGAGGTGGYIIPHTVRMISHLPIADIPSITIIDGDIVEPKNIGRQNFTPSDVGKYKAQCLAERYSLAFGVPVAFINGFLQTYSDISGDIENRSYQNRGVRQRTLIIDTIDNKVGRLKIRNIIRDYMPRNTSWLSVGNTDVNGQLVFMEKNASGYRSIIDVFPQDFSDEAIEEEKKELERISCADNVVINPQSLAINLFGAALVVNLLYQLFHFNTIEHDIIFYDKNSMVRRIKKGEAPFNRKLDNKAMESLCALANMPISSKLFVNTPEQIDDSVIEQSSSSTSTTYRVSTTDSNLTDLISQLI